MMTASLPQQHRDLRSIDSGASGQCYKACTSLNYESRVVNISNLLVFTTQES